ncbi:hypothetical protein HDV06_002855 [Boothiomyces sp. JEL0866]|nr:hypothetical protein HDV06_002855 [Boothiomyces sp. JEL0866]
MNRQEVAKHNTVDDAYVILQDTVYDITDYLEEETHPGGTILLKEYLGKDITTVFKETYPHSKDALELLKFYEIGYDYEIAELEEINSQSQLLPVNIEKLEKRPVLVTNLELTLHPIIDSALKIYEYKQYYIINYKYDPKSVYNAAKYITEISSSTIVLQVDGSCPDNNDGIQVFKKKENSTGTLVGIGASLLSLHDSVVVYRILDNYSFTKNLNTVLKELGLQSEIFKLKSKQSSMFL